MHLNNVQDQVQRVQATQYVLRRMCVVLQWVCATSVKPALVVRKHVPQIRMLHLQFNVAVLHYLAMLLIFVLVHHQRYVLIISDQQAQLVVLQQEYVMLLKHVLVHRLHVLLIANVLRQLCVVLLWVFVMLLKYVMVVPILVRQINLLRQALFVELHQIYVML